MRSKTNWILAVGAAIALPAGGSAADAVDIHSFVECLKQIDSTRVSDAVKCVPSSCKTTVTLSEDSAQPGCTLSDGTRLPRVIFSCPGPAHPSGTPGTTPALRFRPSFSLCTQGGTIKHIELGEDVAKSLRTDDWKLRNFHWAQKMGDIDSSVNFKNLTEIGPSDDPSTVLDTREPFFNSKGCAECHDRKGTVSSGVNTVNLFGPIPTEVEHGTIYTNDPDVDPPATQTPLSVICAGINSSTQLARPRNAANWQLAKDLCSKLEPFAR